MAEHHAGRVGATLLNAAGLPGWLADTPEAFVSTACKRAGDIDTLARLRASLRQQLQASPLCDAEAFTRTFEAGLVYALENRGEGAASTEGV